MSTLKYTFISTYTATESSSISTASDSLLASSHAGVYWGGASGVNIDYVDYGSNQGLDPNNDNGRDKEAKGESDGGWVLVPSQFDDTAGRDVPYELHVYCSHRLLLQWT